ncbi:E3 ubiquitin-protein ligase TRIM33-like isoform X2 [Littorina saxatilis]|uniref:E3 ubiquitin-protein ligase TRIM33-like isoform X2 n=1 Tax=Littorina saxatilis TaxID=31220 RepID=UPI0038B5B846
MGESEILSRCIKCKSHMSAADRTSKLLPCLHTMCEECITGRTDVAEKIKKMHAVKEEKQNGSIEQEKEIEEKKSDVKIEPVKQEVEAKKETKQEGGEKDEKKVPEASEESGESEKSEAGVTHNTEEKPCEESGGDKESNKAPEETATDKQNDEEALHKDKLTLDASDTSKADDTCVPHTEEVSAAKQDEVETKADDNKGDDDGGEKSENEKKDGGEDKATEDSCKQTTEETSMEGVEETPPEPVPLTECPVCREPFNHDSLIDNVFIRKTAATAEDGDGNEQKCTGCESNPASSYCLQCDDWLCSDCVTAHKRVRMTKDHQLTSLEEAVANKGGGAGPKAEVSMMCRVHLKEKLTLFCEKCEVLTCRDCQLLNHQEHKYQFLTEAADSYKAKLTGSLSLMKDRRDVLKRYQTEIEERLGKVKREKSELQQDILRQADVIVKAVRAAVWSVLSSLHSFTDAAAKRLSREVGDVGHLVNKFDHCIGFMEGILEDGFGTPLLFSKSIVETKCRKVYHTHMEPQSLKGQLNIQYRHDVPAVLRTLPNIGAIYVNGSKYPPEKNPTPTTAAPAVAQTNPTLYRGNAIAPPNVSVTSVMPQSQGIPHHLAPQERSVYMQMMMTRQSHGNNPPTQGPTLSLPGSRRVGGMGPTTGPRAWPGSLMSSVMTPGQAGQLQTSLAGRNPTFMPMRLHHRPLDGNHGLVAPPMVLGAQHRPSMGLVSHLPAPPPLRTPSGKPQYRGAAEGAHLNTGGQAAMSGMHRPGVLLATSPDPARPASGGHTPERPLSSEGAASSMRVKSEPMEAGDCVITSANFKGKKSPTMPNTSLGDLQRNLDEVIRGVPLDLGDNLEQINGSESLAISSSVKTSSHLHSPHVSSPTTTAAMTVSSSRVTRSREPSPTKTGMAPTTVTTPTPSDAPPIQEKLTPTAAATDKESSVDGHQFVSTQQVKGYATGNSMPGFTLAAAESADPNDDYCAACHQGGDVLCCDECPRVFHLQCHVPVLGNVPSGNFVCTLCEQDVMLEGQEDGLSSEVTGKRKAPTGLSDPDLKVCERILLELFCHPSSIPFHEPVNRAVPNYYKIITTPMDFTTIKCKLSRNHFNHYPSVESFLDDCKLVFKNCAVYNSETSEVGKAGKIVRGFYERLVERHMRQYSAYARRYDIPESEKIDSDRKKRKTTPPPHSNHTAHGEQLLHVH